LRQAPPPQRRRIAALGVVALVHGGLGWLLIVSVIRPAPPSAEAEETILYLTPAPRPVPRAPAREAFAPAPAPQSAAPPPIPNYSFIAPTPQQTPVFAAPRNDLEQLMHGCAADRLPMMMPEGRARCRFAFGQLPRTDPTADPRETVRNESYWVAERAAARAPPRVPCVTAFSDAIPNGGSGRETG